MASAELNAVGVLLSYSGPATNTVSGTSSADMLIGTNGNDAINNNLGGLGDTMVGGQGDDYYYVYYPHETIIENAGEGVDNVIATVNYVLPDNVENLQLFGSKYGIGNSLDNILVGNGNALQLLDGRGGNDVLIASAKADIFVMEQGGGIDAIQGFKSNLDRARLDGSGFTTFAQVQAALNQVGPDVALSYATGEGLLFRNHQVSDFTAQNFMLPMDTSRLTPTFDDEFNSLSLFNMATNTGTWWTSFGSQNILGSHTLTKNGEKEIYVYPGYTGTGTTDLGLNPFSINNGILSITADRTPAADVSSLYGYQYTSGLLTTKTTFHQEYGYFEIRAKGDVGNGLWPAFWLSPADYSFSNEIDIFEALGKEPNTVNNVIHTRAPGQPSSTLNAVYLTNPDQFHTYGLKWDANYLVYYIDGVETSRFATPADMHQPMYMILNQAVGGPWASDPDSTTPFPSSFQVDYVRAYQLANSPPTAVADSYTATEDAVLNVAAAQGLTANDTDPDVADKDWLSPVLVTGPAHGTVTLNLNGSFSYTPSANYSGVDSFTYSASDGLAQSDPVTVTLTVSPVNDAPTAGASAVTFNEDTTKVFAPSDFQFSDPLDNPVNNLAAVIIATTPSAGTLLFNGAPVIAGQSISVADLLAGHLTFTAAPNANGAGYTNFSFQVRDDGGTAGGGADTSANAATMILNVNPVNDPPTVVGESATAAVSGSASFTTQALLANDSDIDGDALSVIGVAMGANPHGTVQLVGGVVTYTPNVGYSGADSFIYTVSDGQATTPGTVNVTVSAMSSTYTFGGAGNDQLDFSARSNTQLVSGQGGDDTLIGGAGGDSLNGGVGNDLLVGNGGADSITGGSGSDTLAGGTGADTFIFAAVSDFGPPGQEDVITDFSRTDGDKIRLTTIDANPVLAGDQAFTWLGAGAFTGQPGQLHYVQSGPDLIVAGDIDGDGVADFQFKALGLASLQAGDFYL